MQVRCDHQVTAQVLALAVISRLSVTNLEFFRCHRHSFSLINCLVKIRLVEAVLAVGDG